MVLVVLQVHGELLAFQKKAFWRLLLAEKTAVYCKVWHTVMTAVNYHEGLAVIC